MNNTNNEKSSPNIISKPSLSLNASNSSTNDSTPKQTLSNTSNTQHVASSNSTTKNVFTKSNNNRKPLRPLQSKDSLKNLLYNNNNTNYPNFKVEVDKSRNYGNLSHMYSPINSAGNFQDFKSPLVGNKLPIAPKSAVSINQPMRFSSPLNPDSSIKKNKLKLEDNEMTHMNKKYAKTYRSGSTASTPIPISRQPLSLTNTKVKRSVQEMEHNKNVVERIKQTLDQEHTNILNPHYQQPFKNFDEAIERLLPYHIYQYYDKSINAEIQKADKQIKQNSISDKLNIVQNKIRNLKSRMDKEHESAHLNILLDQLVLSKDSWNYGLQMDKKE